MFDIFSEFVPNIVQYTDARQNVSYLFPSSLDRTCYAYCLSNTLWFCQLQMVEKNYVLTVSLILVISLSKLGDVLFIL